MKWDAIHGKINDKKQKVYHALPYHKVYTEGSFQVIRDTIYIGIHDILVHKFMVPIWHSPYRSL